MVRGLVEFLCEFVEGFVREFLVRRVLWFVRGSREDEGVRWLASVVQCGATYEQRRGLCNVARRFVRVVQLVRVVTRHIWVARVCLGDGDRTGASCEAVARACV